MNDSKYGRLYPERAVEPLRTAARDQLDMALQDHDEEATAEWRRVLNALEDKGFPPDEPLFLLRGQDVLASDFVRSYAFMVRHHPQPSVRALDADHIDTLAARMERWQPRKMPD